MYSIYAHINKINGKVYIGQTRNNPTWRWRNGYAYHGCLLFNQAIKKYGWDNFHHVILESNLTLNEANKIEVELIKYYKSINMSYNLTDGGSGRDAMNDIIKLKISKSNKGKKRPFTQEHKDKIRKALKGKKFTPEHIMNIKISHRGQNMGEKNPMYGKKGTDNPNYGRGLLVTIDNDPTIYTADEAAEKMFIQRAGLRRRLKSSDSIKIKSQKTKIIHIVKKIERV